MNLAFSGLDAPVFFDKKHVAVVQIANEALFARICQSLLSGKGESATEPYSVWDDEGKEIRPANAFIPVINPFDLPWKHKSLMGSFPLQIERAYLQDEDLRMSLQSLSSELERTLMQVGFQFNADYAFKIEWSLRNYLKAFGFDIDIPEDASLFDNLTRFVDLAADSCADETLLFVNLKTFLSENELGELYRKLIFHGIAAILLENHDAPIYNDLEQKVVVDRDFVEYQVTDQSEGPSLTQERICSNGFGAVTL